MIGCHRGPKPKLRAGYRSSSWHRRAMCHQSRLPIGWCSL